jgi:hypothetical protein
MVSSVAVVRSGASVSDGSRQNLAGFALGRIGETVLGWLCYCLEKRALGSDGGQRYRQGRDYPVELCGLCVQVHRVSPRCVPSSGVSVSDGSRQNLAVSSPEGRTQQILVRLVCRSY